jgi:hypothetical protein
MGGSALTGLMFSLERPRAQEGKWIVNLITNSTSF